MFTQPVSSPVPGPSTTTTSRPSRLRGLSYLRNYTQNHILSRDTHHGAATSGTVSGSGSGSGSTSPHRHSSILTRSQSHSPTSSGPPATQNSNNTTNTDNNHLTLVSSTPDPVRIASIAIATNNTNTNATSSTTSINASSIPSSASNPISVPLAVTNPFPTSASAPAQQLPVVEAQASFAVDPAAVSTDPAATSTSVPVQDSATDQDVMTRSRVTATDDAVPSENSPSIRLTAYFDPRSTRPSLSFPTVHRTLPTGSEKIRVGRYSERDTGSMPNLPGNVPSAAPVGFKSKVVSRRHCEFWHENGSWYIKDVKSSSGTFLNHIRLSPPSQESKAFRLNDGDIVQLGIDFKGGEEMIFRCVKMRLELNRNWQNKPNLFNMAAHKRLQNMTGTGVASGAASTSSQDCSICLSSIAPCQSLFVAPCSHTWHFKCVRSLLNSPQYPIFICPNCRAGADLEADVDELAEVWRQLKSEEAEAQAEAARQPETEEETTTAQPIAPTGTSTPERSLTNDSDVMDATVSITPETLQRAQSSHAVSEPLPICNAASGAGRSSQLRDSRSPSPPGMTNGAEGPITPRNNAGPWVFDGSAGRNGDALPASGMRSLDAAAEMDIKTSAQSGDDSSR